MRSPMPYGATGLPTGESWHGECGRSAGGPAGSRRRCTRPSPRGRSGAVGGLCTSRAGAAPVRGSRRAPERRAALAAALERPLDAALALPVGDVTPFVADFLAPAEGPAGLEVEPGRDERQAALRDLRGQLVDLAAVEQQLAVAIRVVRGDRGLLVRGDVEPDQPELAVARVRVRALEDRMSLAEGLDLASGQGEPRLDALEQLVLVPRAAVLCDQLLALGLRHAPIVGVELSAPFSGTCVTHTRRFCGYAHRGWRVELHPHPKRVGMRARARAWN